MMKIIGEKYEVEKLSRDIVILDKNVVEFRLEKIKNCSIINAYRIYLYKKKYSKDFFKLYWNNILSSSEKYLQCIIIRERWKNCILMENAIASYLIQNKKIGFNDDWVYIGYHEFTGNRIIVGHGKGIILSRFIDDDIYQEIENTKLYIKRLGMTYPKLFSTFKDLKNYNYVNFNEIISFINTNNNLLPIFSKNHRILEYFLYILISLLFVCLISIFIELKNYKSTSFYYPTKINNDKINIKISENNYEQLNALLQALKDNIDFWKIDKFCKKYKLNIKQIELNQEVAKIIADVPLKILNQIKEAKLEYATSNDFEKFLDENKNIEVKLWLKLK